MIAQNRPKDDDFFDPVNARKVRVLLEKLAKKVESFAADTENTSYLACFRKCARVIRDAKPD